MRNSKRLGGLLVLLAALAGQTAMAQSTIFNIPTTDTVTKGKAYFEFDFLPRSPHRTAPTAFTHTIHGLWSAFRAMSRRV